MSFDNDLKAIRSIDRADGDRLRELARAALAEQREEDVLPLLRDATRTAPDARLLQWKGLLERALDEHADALGSFGAAARLAPGDASIAHGHARVALEAGLPAVQLFAHALELAPNDPQVYIGLNAARIAAGQGEQAEAELDCVLERSPLWVEGHHQLSQLRSLLGRRERAFESLERAIASQQRNAPLWQALFDLQVLAEDYSLLDQTLRRARTSGVPPSALGTYEFIAAAELGQTSLADSLSGGAAATTIPPVWRVRHHLRSGRVDQAATLVDAELQGPRAADMWPYATSVWHMSRDPRLEWLTGNTGLISVIDLSSDLAAISGLPNLLRSLHEGSGRYLNQSVRGGSQTDGPLLSRIEPEIRALRAVIVRAVEGYLAPLAGLPDGHPQKPRKRSGSIRFSGSWSVRLVDGGFHVPHVHPQGWISSALYISLPGRGVEGEGWLTLGQPPPELDLDIPPAKMVEPNVGRLVLFPSWMWHGTNPFPEGERLAVAFDVAPPA